MNTKIEITQASLKNFKKKLKNMSKEQERKLRNAVIETALLVESDSKMKTPVKTGRLRSSIHQENSSTTNYQYSDSTGKSYNGYLGGVKEKLQAIVGTNVRYALKQEAIHSYLSSAIAFNRIKFIEKVKKILK